MQAANEGVLDDLLGGRAISDPPLDEAKKVAMVRDQHVDHGLRQGARGRGVSSSCMARR